MSACMSFRFNHGLLFGFAGLIQITHPRSNERPQGTPLRIGMGSEEIIMGFLTLRTHRAQMWLNRPRSAPTLLASRLATRIRHPLIFARYWMLEIQPVRRAEIVGLVPAVPVYCRMFCHR